MYGRSQQGRTAYSAAGFREDLGHYVRSSWEADFARVLKHLGTPYQYEPRRFTLSRADGSTLTYAPDFFVPESRCFYEIKGWMDERSAEKIRLFREQYPDETLVVIDKTQFAELQMRYGDLAEWECPKVPDSTSFVKIKSITYEGEEETFDIKMRAPGNNFLANGFVVHNSGMSEICRKLRPKSIEDLSALNALYRPGPLDGGMVDDFIDRYHGKKPVEYLTPEMEEILRNTYGILVYQEQIMQLAQRLGGYSLGEADLMRRAMGKKKREEMAVHEEKFIAGCVRNKIPKKKAREIFRLMAQFADYGFNRCLTGDAEVIDADTGEPVSVRDIAEGRVAVARTFSFDGEHVFVNEIVEAFETGEKEVVEIETEDGLTIRCTLDHKFYTDEGYLPLREIIERGLELSFSPEVAEYAASRVE